MEGSREGHHYIRSVGSSSLSARLQDRGL